MSDINNVSHNADKLCFETTVDGHRAHLDYRTIDEETLDFHHTFVPDELRGRGVAAELTEAALAYAEEQGFKVHPSCSYVETFMKRKGIPAA